MSEKVEPALSAEEWKAPQDVIAGYVDADSGIIDVTLGGPGGADRPRSTWALIALLNSWLPDSDPRKITREKLDLARAGLDRLDGPQEDALALFLDALESYLPPPV